LRYTSCQLGRQLLAQAPESAVLQDAHGSRRLSQDCRDVFDVEPSQNAEEDDLRLIGRQASQTTKRNLRLARREHLRFGTEVVGRQHVLGWIDGDPAAPLAAAIVG
jgi:hypothetical protein